MHRKFSKILSFLLFGFIFVFQSCQKEDYQEFNQDNTKLYHKKFSDIIKENTFRTTFEKVNKAQRKLTSASKTTAMEHQNGFKIASEEANVIVNDSMTSYTLSIVRDNTPDNEFENLIIIVPNNNSTETTAFIYKYTSTTSFKEVPFDPKTFSGTKTLIPIDFDLTIVNSLNQNPDDLLVCHPVESWYCYGEGHHTSSDGCTMGFSITENNCVNIATGGPLDPSGSANTGTNTGGTYGNGSYSNTTSGPKVVTATVPPCKTCNLISDPCAKIKSLTSKNPSMSNELANLATQTNLTYEVGKYKTNNSNLIQNTSTGSNTKVELPIPTSGQFEFIAHTHNGPADSTYSVFSYADFEAIIELVKAGTISESTLFFLSTADDTNYAMSIDNLQQFSQFFALVGEPNFDMEVAMRRTKVMFDYYDIAGNGNPIIKENSTIGNIGDEKAFLDMITDLKMGVSLLEADATFTNFTQLSHNKTTGNIDKQPCN